MISRDYHHFIKLEWDATIRNEILLIYFETFWAILISANFWGKFKRVGAIRLAINTQKWLVFQKYSLKSTCERKTKSICSKKSILEPKNSIEEDF